MGCGGDGHYLLAVKVGHPLFGKLQRCECWNLGRPLTSADLPPKAIALAAPPRQTMQTRDDVQERRTMKLIDELGSLKHCTFETFLFEREDLKPVEFDGKTYSIEQQREALSVALDAASSFAHAEEIAGGMIFLGPTGSGKSHLAAAIANVAVARGLNASYATVPALIDHVRDGFQDHSASDRRSELERVDLLVLDDLDPMDELSKDERLMFQVVNARHLANLPTIVTTNFALRHHGRVGSRIAGMAGYERTIRLVAADYRTREWRKQRQ